MRPVEATYCYRNLASTNVNNIIKELLTSFIMSSLLFLWENHFTLTPVI